MNTKTMLRIAVIEDDANMMFFYRSVLEPLFTLQFFDRLSQIDCDHWPFDLTIADMVLPDGILIDRLPAFFSNNRPTLIISSLDELSAMRRTKYLGCVDYLIKPLTANELVFKIESILANRNGLDLRRSILSNLTPKEEKIVKLLEARVGRQCARSEIQELLWNGIAVQTNTLDVHLSNLRKKLQPHGYNIVTNPDGRIELVNRPIN